MDATITAAVRAAINRATKDRITFVRTELKKALKEVKADPLDPVKIRKASDASAVARTYEAAVQDVLSLFGDSASAEPPKPKRSHKKKVRPEQPTFFSTEIRVVEAVNQKPAYEL